MNVVTIIIAIVALLAGCAIGYAIFRYVIKGKYNDLIEAASKEAEVIKEKKLLEVKEKFLNKKSELEKEVQQRNLKFQQNENRLKQREITLNQRQEELGRRKIDVDQEPLPSGIGAPLDVPTPKINTFIPFLYASRAASSAPPS